ncbi:MAG: hypothetical protein ACD_22C00047G0014 [uncultured bacterium]|nr:MAG: hypothetical protein ACD_22C00047G0014 [uncultured bacterium]
MEIKEESNPTTRDSKDLRVMLEELRRQAKDRHFSRANLWNGEVNKIESELRNISFIISTTLITITASSFFINSKMTAAETTLLALFWFSLALSLICGFIEHLRIRKFFLEAARRESNAERTWSKVFPSWDEYQQFTNEVDKLYIHFKDEEIPTFLYMQLFFIFMALVFLVWKSLLIVY